ncbi:MAG: DUF2071 domain-containing protein [Opitutaceae bacterium]|nr:DUF2071 domain-containing protein [Opitutaceae bacterium]MBP9913093.1 DUF2071 domain-containing protein [Opitutaceae bacterium]
MTATVATETLPPPVTRPRPDLRPTGHLAGRQRWDDLLFLHWPVDPRLVQATLPPGLQADTFEGRAFVGIVPFSMQRVRPAWLPPLPWISWFLELNVRTYVRDPAGRPSVWFYSLDCNQPLAVALAKRFFHLPYKDARMTARHQGRSLHYTCQRREPGAAACTYEWTPGTASRPAQPGSLDYFLIERYRLYTADRAGHLFTGQVHHAPYQLDQPDLKSYSSTPARMAGFTLDGPPVSALGAKAVDVSIYPLQPVGPAFS